MSAFSLQGSHHLGTEAQDFLRSSVPVHGRGLEAEQSFPAQCPLHRQQQICKS